MTGHHYINSPPKAQQKVLQKSCDLCRKITVKNLQTDLHVWPRHPEAFSAAADPINQDGGLLKVRIPHCYGFRHRRMSH